MYSARVHRVEGKSTFISSSKLVAPDTKVTSISVIGREESTNAERARDEYILQLLQGKTSIDSPDAPFISHIWFPQPVKSLQCKARAKTLRVGREGRYLNQSQSNVVEAMVCSQNPITLVHGPPGTGKTSTISVAIREWSSSRSPVWAVAQSNVGVKNIAESLAKHGVSFKLLVSKEFYFEW